MADTTLSIGVVAELSEFRKAMETLPGIGEKEARDMVTGIRRQLKAAESAAGGTAKATSSAFSSEFNKVSSAAAALSAQVGGTFGRIGSVANAALRPIAEVASGMSGLGGAAAGVAGGATAAALAIALAAAAAVQLVGAAQEARARLEALGEPIPDDAAKGLDEYGAATKQLHVAVDQLTVALGAELAPTLAVIASNTASAIEWTSGWASSWSNLRDEILHVTSFGIIPYERETGKATLATLDAAAAQDKLTESIKANFLEYGPLATAEQVHADLVVRAKIAQDAYNAALRATAEARKRDSEDAARTREEMLAQVAAEQRAVENYKDRSFLHLSASSSKYKIKAINDEHDITLAKQHEDAVQAQSDAEKRAAETAQTIATTSAYLQAADQVLGSIAAIGDAAVQRAEDQIASGDKLSRAEVKSANNAIALSRDVSIVQAGISATLAGLGTYTALVAEFTPPPVAAAIGATVATASFAAAAAGIASGTPSFFHYDGGGQDKNDFAAAGGGSSNAVDPTTGHVNGKPGPNDIDVGDVDGPPRAGGKGSTSRTSGGVTIGLHPDAARVLRVYPGQRRGGPR